MSRFLMNRLGNAGNFNQGQTKKVLCVCSAGLLRSPTTAVVLSQEPYNYNTRAAGLVESYALVYVDQVLLYWADEIVCMTLDQKAELEKRLESHGYEKPVICLEIEDSYGYRSTDLIKLIKKNYPKPASKNEKSGSKST
jgi:predicted protein tyrosine phosphatase